MRKFWGLTKRNLLLFFKDKQMIFFSLLTSIIVLALYLLFLKGTFIDAIKSGIEQYPGLSTLISDSETDMFANLFLLTGIIGSALITVPYNCLLTLVRDRENKIDYDILSTPVKRGQIILSYFSASAISSVILTGIILSIGLGVIRLQGDFYMDPVQILKTYGIVALGSVSATAFFMIIVMFFKSTGASAAFLGILSAAAGFIIGAYIPISEFSDGVQTVCNLFPASQITIILRNMLMNGLLDHMNESIGGDDDGMFVQGLKDTFTFDARLFEKSYDTKQMLIFVIAMIFVCLALQVAVFSRTYKKK